MLNFIHATVYHTLVMHPCSHFYFISCANMGGCVYNLFVTMRTLTIWKGREWEGKGSGGRTRMTKENKRRGDGKIGARKGGMMHVTI